MGNMPWEKYAMCPLWEDTPHMWERAMGGNNYRGRAGLPILKCNNQSVHIYFLVTKNLVPLTFVFNFLYPLMLLLLIFKSKHSAQLMQ